MLRQIAARGIGTIVNGTRQCPALLGAAGARELSGQGNSREESASTLPLCNSSRLQSTLTASVHQLLRSLPPKPTARLEIWRQCSTASTAAVAPRPVTFAATVSSKKAKSVARKAKPARPAAHSNTKKGNAPARSQAKGSQTARTSRASGTARGRAAAERRRTADAGKVKEARAAAKAQAAATLAKAKAREKARVDKLRSEIKARVAKAAQAKTEAVAKVRAEAREKLKSALEKAKAKADKQVARVVGKSVKRAPSALNLYIREQCKSNPSITLKEVSMRFKALSAEEKQKYLSQAAAAKAELLQQRDRAAAERAARRATPAYTFFFMEKRPSIVAANPDASMIDVARRLGEMWRGMSAEQRQKYVGMSEADRMAKGLQASPQAAAAADVGSPATVSASV